MVKHKHILSTQLAATSLSLDPRVAEARRLLHEAVHEHQKEITQIKPAEENLKQSYAEMLTVFAQIRGSKLWFPYIGSGFGNGVLVELADGSIKYDFITGIGTHYWGHNHHDLLDSSLDAALSNTIMQGHLQQNIDSLQFSMQLVQASGLGHCFLTSSGAMANENALKMAFQKNYPATRVLAFERCFVGRTLGISQITDKAAFREGLPPTLLVDYVPFFDVKAPEESTKHALDAIKKYLVRYPKQHAVMCFELIQGEGGFYEGTKEFFSAIMRVLKENHIAIISDEVQTFGRTPELFAFQYFGLQEFIDIATIGKLSQTCATLFTDAYKPRPGLLSQTYTASTSAIKAASVILDGLLNDNFYGPKGKIARLHEHFIKHFEQLEKKHPHLIQGPYGIGCMVAFTPYKGDNQKVVDFVHRLFDAGVMSFTAGGGSNPTRVRFLIPAGVVTEKDIDNVMTIVEKVLIEG